MLRVRQPDGSAADVVGWLDSVTSTELEVTTVDQTVHLLDRSTILLARRAPAARGGPPPGRVSAGELEHHSVRRLAGRRRAARAVDPAGRGRVHRPGQLLSRCRRSRCADPRGRGPDGGLRPAARHRADGPGDHRVGGGAGPARPGLDRHLRSGPRAGRPARRPSPARAAPGRRTGHRRARAGPGWTPTSRAGRTARTRTWFGGFSRQPAARVRLRWGADHCHRPRPPQRGLARSGLRSGPGRTGGARAGRPDSRQPWVIGLPAAGRGTPTCRSTWPTRPLSPPTSGSGSPDTTATSTWHRPSLRFSHPSRSDELPLSALVANRKAWSADRSSGLAAEQLLRARRVGSHGVKLTAREERGPLIVPPAGSGALLSGATCSREELVSPLTQRTRSVGA